MDASPSLTDDGSVILGKRLSRVYVLDRATGNLLQHLSDVLPPPEQHHHPHAHGGKGPGSPLGIEGERGFAAGWGMRPVRAAVAVRHEVSTPSTPASWPARSGQCGLHATHPWQLMGQSSTGRG